MNPSLPRVRYGGNGCAVFCEFYLAQIRRLVLRRSKLFLGLLQTPMELGLASLLNGH